MFSFKFLLSQNIILDIPTTTMEINNRMVLTGERENKNKKILSIIEGYEQIVITKNFLFFKETFPWRVS